MTSDERHTDRCVPREVAGGRAPPVLEVQLVGAAVLLAVELRLHEGAPRRVVHRQRVVVHPAALEQVARRHAGAGGGAATATATLVPSPVPRAVVLPRGLAMPEAERARARDLGGGAARAQQRPRDGRGEERQEAQLPLPLPLLGRHCAALWSEQRGAAAAGAGPCGDGHGRIR